MMDLKVGFPAGMPLGGIGTGLIEHQLPSRSKESEKH